MTPRSSLLRRKKVGNFIQEIPNFSLKTQTEVLFEYYKMGKYPSQAGFANFSPELFVYPGLTLIGEAVLRDKVSSTDLRFAVDEQET